MMSMPIVLGMMPAKHPRTRTMSERLVSSILVGYFVEDQLNQEHVEEEDAVFTTGAVAPTRSAV